MRVLRWFLLSLVGLVLIGMLLLVWLVRSEQASRWAVAWLVESVDGLVIDGVAGTLARGWSAETIRYVREGLSLELADLSLEISVLDLLLDAPTLRVNYVTARSLSIETVARADAVEPPWRVELPTLPMDVDVGHAEVTTMLINGLRFDSAMLAGCWCGQSLDLRNASVNVEGAAVGVRGSVDLAHDGPVALQGRWSWQTFDGTLVLGGQRQRIALVHVLEGAGAALRSEGRVLLPEAWPLAFDLTHGWGELTFATQGTATAEEVHLRARGGYERHDVVLAALARADASGWQVEVDATADGPLADGVVARARLAGTGDLVVDVRARRAGPGTGGVANPRLSASGDLQTLDFALTADGVELAGRATGLSASPTVTLRRGALLATPIGPWRSEQTVTISRADEDAWRVSEHCWSGGGEICLERALLGSEQTELAGRVRIDHPPLEALGLPPQLDAIERIDGRWQARREGGWHVQADATLLGLHLRSGDQQQGLPPIALQAELQGERWRLTLAGEQPEFSLGGALSGGLQQASDINGKVDINVADLAAWSALAGAPVVARGPLALHLQVDGTLQAPEVLGEAVWKGALADTRGGQWLGGVSLEAVFSGASWRLQALVDDAALAATLAIEGAGYDLATAIDGRLLLESRDLQALAAALEPVDRLGGMVTAELQISGTLEAPRFAAVGGVAAGAVVLVDPPLALDGIDVDFTADNDGWQAVGEAWQSDREQPGRFAFHAAGAGFSPAAAIVVDVDAQKLSLQSELWQLLVDGKLQARAADGRIAFTGRAEVPTARIALEELPASVPRPSPDVVVIDRPLPETETTRLDGRVSVRLGDDVRLTLPGLQGRLTGTLDAVITNGEVSALRGEIDVAEGTVSAAGQTLSVRSGRVLFSGPPDRPYVDVVATRTIGDRQPPIDVGVRVRGEVDQLETSVYSEPPMTETRALSFLVLGRDFNESSELDSQALLNAALGLGLKRSTGVVQQLQRSLGLDELQALSTAQNDVAIVAGKRITDDLYVRYTYNALAAVGSLILRYHLTDRWRLEATTEGGNAMDLLYEFTR